jgi:transglutaminase-like putative cysteine protease
MTGRTPPVAAVREVPLRGAVLALELSAATAVGVAGLAPWPAVAGTAVALVAASVAAATGGQRNLRSALGFLSLVIAVLACLATAGLGSTTLAFISLWLMVTAQLSADTVRELAVTALLSLALMLLPGGLAPTPALAVPWLVGWVAAVSTLVLAVRRSARDGSGHARARTERADASDRGAAGPIAAAVGVSLLCALVVALVMPEAGGTAAQRMQALSRLTGQHPNQPQRTSTSYLGGLLDMRTRGEMPDEPVAQVAADSAQYWRSGTLSTYDGVTWRAAQDRTVTPGVQAAGGRFWVAAALADGGAIPSPASGSLREDRVTMVAPSTGFLLSPGHPASVRTDSGGQVLVAGGSMVFATASAGPSYGYTVQWAAQPGAADVPGPDVVSAEAAQAPPGNWLQLPETVTARTRALAQQVTAGARTRGEQVAMLERYLSSTYPYNLDSPVPPAGQDAVDHFLFDARTGFCEQFAAAEVVMLRSLGVPARMATGYAFGTVRGDVRVLSGKDAHAWVEVWQPGQGWLTSDATPSSGAAGRSEAGPGAMAAALREVMASTRARWLLAAGLLLLGGVVVAVVLLLGRRRRALALPTDPASMDPLAWAVSSALTDLGGALREAGRGSPPAETVAELARRVPEVAPRAFATAERTMYGRRLPSPELVDEAVRDLRTGARTIRQQLQGAPSH